MKVKLRDGSTINSMPETASQAALVVAIDSDADLRGYANALPALTSIGGPADLLGYAHALPALTSIGGSAYLLGYAHADWPWLINGGVESRGYYFTGILVDGEWRIRAGCRDFTIEQSLTHWGSGGRSNRPDCLALVNKIKAIAEERGK